MTPLTPSTTPTFGSVLPVDLTQHKCLAKTKKGGQCKAALSKETVSKVQAILELPITYLEGDRKNIRARINSLASLLIHLNLHKEDGAKRVKELESEYWEIMKRHLEAKRHEGGTIAVSEAAEPVRISERTFEEHSLSITQPRCTEITEASEVSHVTDPALPTTHTFLVEDKEEITVASSNVPRALLHSNNNQSCRLAKSSTPLPNEVPGSLDAVPNTHPMLFNPLLSLVVNIMQQMFMGFFSSVQARRGVVPVEDTSGQIENKSVVDLKIMLGMRLAPGMVPILLGTIVFVLYYQTWSIIGFLAS